MALFKDRKHAGRILAEKLTAYQNQPEVVVLGLPRGGVLVGYEIALALNAPLDVFIVRKLGMPGHEELALGAISSGGIRVLNDEIVHELNISNDVLEMVTQRELQELKRREQAYRGDHPPLDVRGRSVILVDDGLATGASMRAAVSGLRTRRPHRIVVAVPVAASDICKEFEAVADEVVCAVTPKLFHGVGMWYEDFTQITDKEVQNLLEKSASQAQHW